MDKIKCKFPAWKHTILKSEDVLDLGDYLNEWDRANVDWKPISSSWAGHSIATAGRSYQIFIRPIKRFPDFN